MATTVKSLRITRCAARSAKATRRKAQALKVHRLKDVAGKLHERQSDRGLTQSQSEEIVQDVLDIVQEILSSGDDVLFTGFGKFSCRETGKRMYYNPKTGERFERDSTVSVRFKPGLSLKRTIKDTVGSEEGGVQEQAKE